MKKLLALVLAALMILVLVACNNTEETTTGNNETSSTTSTTETTESTEAPKPPIAANALEIMDNIWASYDDDNRFFCFGGYPGAEEMVENGPATLPLNTDALYNWFQLPEATVALVDDAASLCHGMNTNSFTAAVFHLKDEGDAEAFANSFKETIQDYHFVCGAPTWFTVISLGDGYVLRISGADGLVETFRDAALALYEGATVICDESVR